VVSLFLSGVKGKRCAYTVVSLIKEREHSMGCNTAELREKDVISTKDGRKLGYITDFEIDVSCGKILAILVSSPSQRLFWHSERCDYRIPWEKIECIGEDAVLVCQGDWMNGCETCRTGQDKKKSGWFL